MDTITTTIKVQDVKIKVASEQYSLIEITLTDEQRDEAIMNIIKAHKRRMKK